MPPKTNKKRDEEDERDEEIEDGPKAGGSKGAQSPRGARGGGHAEIEPISDVLDLCDSKNLTVAKLSQGLKALALHQEECWGQVDDNTKDYGRAAEDIKFLAETAQETDKRLFHIEMEKVRANIIIKNLKWLDPKKASETPSQTREVVENFIKKTLAVEKVKVVHAKRFPDRKDAKGPPMIKVTLGSGAQKAMIFRGLAKANLKTNVRVDNEYPAALRPIFKKAEDEAFQIRQKTSRKTKTKLVPKDGAVILFVLGPKDKEYTLLKVFPAKIADPDLYATRTDAE